MKLNQVIALSGGKKSRFIQRMTATHHGWGKGKESPVYGIRRTYLPIKDGGEEMPTESRRVQTTVQEQLKAVVNDAKDLFDVVCCHELGNTKAVADVVVDGEALILNAPVGFLLFLEKQLKDFHALVKGFPTLPTDREWEWDANKACHVAEPERTRSTKKIDKPIVLCDATEHHPAQIQIVKTDECVGHWTMVQMSGALPAQTQNEAIERVVKLQEAVKMDREEANCQDVDIRQISHELLDYIFQPILEK